MTQTLNVEYEELIARAVELEEPMPVPPQTDPQGPCTLPFIVDSATQLKLSADSLRLYLAACEREWRRLAQSLRNAAKAYEQVDEEAAEALDTETDISGNGSMVAFCDPDEDWGGWVPTPPPPPPPVVVPYYEVRQAATDIEAPDQGTAFNGFNRDWDTFQRNLQATTYRFRPFNYWEGTSATLVEANFAAHRTWIYQVAQSCSTLAAQAKTVTAAQKWAITEHPSVYEVSEADKWYMIYNTDPYYKNNPNTPAYIYNVLDWYRKMQAKSEEILAEYVRRAALPLSPVFPTPPPAAHRIDPPPKPDPDNPDDPDNPGDPDNPDFPDPDDPGFPDDDYGDTPATPSVPSTPSIPSTPSTPSTGVPPLPDGFEEALAAASGQGEPSMKPASVGAGGGGGMPGGAGIPSMPMQPSVGAESVAPAGPGGRGDMANAGRGLPGAGGGPMGGMPMGGGAGGNQGGKEGKRGPEADQSLYEEDRPWTEAVIGNRRRKDAPEK